MTVRGRKQLGFQKNAKRYTIEPQSCTNQRKPGAALCVCKGPFGYTKPVCVYAKSKAPYITSTDYSYLSTVFGKIVRTTKVFLRALRDTQKREGELMPLLHVPFYAYLNCFFFFCFFLRISTLPLPSERQRTCPLTSFTGAGNSSALT